MKTETIGNAIFRDHTRGMACNVLPGRHAPASVERVRTDSSGVAYYCAAHAESRMRQERIAAR